MTVAEVLQTSDGLAMLAETPVASAFEELITHAAAAGANTVHLEPFEGLAKVRYRIDGALHEGSNLTHRALQVLIAHIKHRAQLHIDEQRWPQEGTLHVDLGPRSFDVKVATIPVATGEKAVLHIFDTRHKVHSLEELGLWGSSRKQINAALAARRGMVIVSGPHHAGISTTLHSLLKKIDHPTTQAASLESHIRTGLPRVSQLKVYNPQQSLSTLRAALAHDTDVVMIDNLQQKELFQLSAEASVKGRMILGGIAAQSLEQTIEHLSALAESQHQLAHSLSAIVYQRLARRLCDNCKQPTKLSAAELKALSGPTKVTMQTLQIFLNETRRHAHEANKIALYAANPQGCAACRHTGFKGQVGIFEVMTVSRSVQKLIAHHADPRSIATQAVREGMIPTSIDGLIKALGGITTLSEVLKATK